MTRGTRSSISISFDQGGHFGSLLLGDSLLVFGEQVGHLLQGQTELLDLR